MGKGAIFSFPRCRGLIVGFCGNIADGEAEGGTRPMGQSEIGEEVDKERSETVSGGGGTERLQLLESTGVGLGRDVDEEIKADIACTLLFTEDTVHPADMTETTVGKEEEEEEEEGGGGEIVEGGGEERGGVEGGGKEEVVEGGEERGEEREEEGEEETKAGELKSGTPVTGKEVELTRFELGVTEVIMEEDTKGLSE